MKIRIEEQEQRFLRTSLPETYTTKTYFGPCLVCDKEIEYEHPSPLERYGEEWLRKHFEPALRSKHVSSLQSAEWVRGALHPKTLEPFVCGECWKTCKNIQHEDEKRLRTEMEVVYAASGRRDAERAYHYEWREAKPGEFSHTSCGSAQFRMVLPEGNPVQLTFLWRPAKNDGQCRGDSPRNVVGVWMNGRLTCWYYGWDLAPYGNDWSPNPHREYESEDLSLFQDVFGEGFCRILERFWQDELVVCKPDFVLNMRSPRRTWPPSFEPPALIHVQWLDGSVYADVLTSRKLPDVAEFAHNRLGIRIEKQSFHPVLDE